VEGMGNFSWRSWLEDLAAARSSIMGETLCGVFCCEFSMRFVGYEMALAIMLDFIMLGGI